MLQEVAHYEFQIFKINRLNKCQELVKQGERNIEFLMADLHLQLQNLGMIKKIKSFEWLTFTKPQQARTYPKDSHSFTIYGNLLKGQFFIFGAYAGTFCNFSAFDLNETSTDIWGEALGTLSGI